MSGKQQAESLPWVCFPGVCFSSVFTWPRGFIQSIICHSCLMPDGSCLWVCLILFGLIFLSFTTFPSKKFKWHIRWKMLHLITGLSLIHNNLILNSLVLELSELLITLPSPCYLWFTYSPSTNLLFFSLADSST